MIGLILLSFILNPTSFAADPVPAPTREIVEAPFIPGDRPMNACADDSKVCAAPKEGTEYKLYAVLQGPGINEIVEFRILSKDLGNERTKPEDTEEGDAKTPGPEDSDYGRTQLAGAQVQGPSNTQRAIMEQRRRHSDEKNTIYRRMSRYLGRGLMGNSFGKSI